VKVKRPHLAIVASECVSQPIHVSVDLDGDMLGANGGSGTANDLKVGLGQSDVVYTSYTHFTRVEGLFVDRSRECTGASRFCSVEAKEIEIAFAYFESQVARADTVIERAPQAPLRGVEMHLQRTFIRRQGFVFREA
jgi:hypothetical protein